MQRYPAWQALFRSFYSMDFYRDVAQNWKEVGFLYLFLMAGLSWAAIATSFQIALSSSCDKVFLPLVDQMPDVSCIDGKYSIDKPCPYHIRDLTSGKPIVTFDTTGATKSLDSPGLLLTEHELTLFSDDPASGQTSDAKVLLNADSSPGSLSKTNVRDFILLIRNFGGLLIFLFGWISGAIFLFVQTVLYATIGLVIRAISKTELNFAQLMRIAALAITPPLLLDSLLKTFTPTILQADKGSSLRLHLASFLISMVYLYLGISANKQDSSLSPGEVTSGADQSVVQPES